jgi:hypothetical protein
MSSARRNLSCSAKFRDIGEPFAEGAFRLVAKGVYNDGTGPRNGQSCVLKWFKSGGVYQEIFFTDDIRAVEKAQDIIDSFNAAGVYERQVYLNHPEVWTLMGSGREQALTPGKHRSSSRPHAC